MNSLSVLRLVLVFIVGSFTVPSGLPLCLCLWMCTLWVGFTAAGAGGAGAGAGAGRAERLDLADSSPLVSSLGPSSLQA